MGVWHASRLDDTLLGRKALCCDLRVWPRGAPPICLRHPKVAVRTDLLLTTVHFFFHSRCSLHHARRTREASRSMTSELIYARDRPLPFAQTIPSPTAQYGIGDRSCNHRDLASG